MFLSTSELARRLHVSEQTIRSWHASGKITGYRSGPGGALRFHERQVMHELQTAPTVERDAYHGALVDYISGGTISAVLETGRSPSGGYLCSSPVINGLSEAVAVGNPIRQRGWVLPPIDADTGRVVSIDTAPVAAWGEECPSSDISPDAVAAFGARELTPHYQTCLIRVSRRMLAQTPDAEALCTRMAGMAFSTLEDAAFMVGTGVRQPLGLFIADAQGIDTDRDVTVASTTAFTAQELQEIPNKVDQVFRPGSCWIMHPDTVLKIRKLLGGDGSFLYQVNDNAPDTLCGYPIVESSNAPNTFTAGKYVIVFGNLSIGYAIQDSNFAMLQRLTETRARVNEVELLYRRMVDAAPVVSLAFARLQLAAA